MYKNNRILALIPARGESKGLPGKNIRSLLGKPLIAWSIEQALGSKYIDKVLVSTESPVIASIARRYGADVPFLRPKKLATDKASSIDVILHAMQWAENNQQVFDIIMLLQPTSPLRSSVDIDASIKWLSDRDAQAVVSVCKVEHNPLWSNTLPKDCSMKDFIKAEVVNKSRQELSIFYRLNGAIYLSNWEHFKNQKSFFGSKTSAFIMPVDRSIDIDTKFDFELGEFIGRKHKVF